MTTATEATTTTDRREMRWTTTTGRAARVSVERLSRPAYADGHATAAAVGETAITAYVDGDEVGAGGPCYRSDLPAGYAAVIGRLGLTAEQAAEIEAMASAVAPAADPAAAEYDAHRERMARIMGY